MLGSRIALAIREHALGEAVNGTGPRLVSITQPSSTTIKVKTTRTINDHSTYDGYFSVDEVVMDGGSELRQDVPITSIGKDPLDGTAVLISLSRAISGTPSVKYAPPSGLSQGQSYPNVVQDSDGLPLPAFGTHGAS